MSECEGISTALSVLLSRFKLLLRVTYYDNGCNMPKSIAIRAPSVNESTLVLCDRFHYKSHSCNSNCDPVNHQSCSVHHTSGAESINQLWNFSKNHVTFLNADNLMPFLLHAILVAPLSTTTMNDIQIGKSSEPAPEKRPEESQRATISQNEPNGNLSEATPEYR